MNEKLNDPLFDFVVMRIGYFVEFVELHTNVSIRVSVSVRFSSLIFPETNALTMFG